MPWREGGRGRKGEEKREGGTEGGRKEGRDREEKREGVHELHLALYTLVLLFLSTILFPYARQSCLLVRCRESFGASLSGHE